MFYAELQEYDGGEPMSSACDTCGQEHTTRHGDKMVVIYFSADQDDADVPIVCQGCYERFVGDPLGFLTWLRDRGFAWDYFAAAIKEAESGAYAKVLSGDDGEGLELSMRRLKHRMERRGMVYRGPHFEGGDDSA